MKHLLIICSLLAIGLNTPAFGQAEEAPQQSELPIEKDSGDSLKMKLDTGFDEEISAEEKIKKVTQFITELDSELGKEFELELGSLSHEEKTELLEELSDGFDFGNSMNGTVPAGAVLISVAAIIMIFGTPLFLLIALLSAGHRKRKQKMELVNLYINNDRDIPEHVLTGLDSGGSANSLKSGLTLTAVGVGVVAAFSALGASEVGGFGLIPMFLGIARLIFWFLVERKNESKVEL